MNESENALPLDESFWEHWHHTKVGVGIPVSEDKTMNVLAVLEDIYHTVDINKDEAKRLIIMMAAILLASKDDQADEVWQEMVVSESMIDLDANLKEILNEES
jgi:hypothetical protein